jgi:hypothetical protein
VIYERRLPANLSDQTQCWAEAQPTFWLAAQDELQKRVAELKRKSNPLEFDQAWS